MKKIIIFSILLFILPIFNYAQEKVFSNVKTNSGEVKIPGEWKQLNSMDDSGQTYLKDGNGVIIAIAKNPQKAYSFYKNDNSDFENVKEFYKWDSNYRSENNFKTKKLKENSKLNYIIWQYNDGKLDNIFLFGVVGNFFLNLLVYTDLWNESEKIEFLENLFEINK